jgi:hypothetical protein
MADHTYQFGTIAQLRKIHEENSAKAKASSYAAQVHLAEAGTHAALARDAAVLLNVADSEWTAECETPIVARTLRLKAWREMLDFLEAHPEIGLGGYESIGIEQPNGERATPEYLESLEHLGIKVERTQKHVVAELWFGNHDVVLRTYANIEPPADIELVIEPDTGEEHQALEAAADADEAECPSREEQPIQINDRVRVHHRLAADDDGSRTDFPDDFEGREGIVTEVRLEAFATDRGATDDAEDLPIDVMLDGECEVHCFTVAEVEVLVTVEQRIETMDRLLGQPA